MHIQELREALTGPVFAAGEPGYDDERAGFNLAVQQQPSVIVGAMNAHDVAAAVDFAAGHHLPVSVHATGHGAAGPGLGAVMISTRRMSGISIDPAKRLARVEAGVRWQPVIDAAAEHGLAPLNGSSPTVGVVSYTLGGGLGPLGRRYGWAADRVRAIDVVTADGKLRTVTATRHPDLFWALRGSKGNLGVVTALEFELVPLTTIYGGGLFFPGEAAPQVLHAYQRWTLTVPDEMTSSLALLRLPSRPGFPAEFRGRFVVHVRIAYAGPAAAGERVVAPLRAIGPRLLDTVADMPYRENAAIHGDPLEPLPGYERTTALRCLDAATVEAVLSLAGPDSDCPLVLVELRHLGGALARQPEHPNAVGNRDGRFAMTLGSVCGADEATEIVAYGDKLLAAVEPWATGGRLLNFLGVVPPHMYSDAWEPRDYERLGTLKAVYDPANRFCLNINIPPRTPEVPPA